MCNRESFYRISRGKESDMFLRSNFDNKEGPSDHQSCHDSRSTGHVSDGMIKLASCSKFHCVWLHYLHRRSMRGRDCTISILGCVCNDSNGDQNNVLLFFSLPELKLLQGKDLSSVPVLSWSQLSSINYRTHSGRPQWKNEYINLSSILKCVCTLFSLIFLFSFVLTADDLMISYHHESFVWLSEVHHVGAFSVMPLFHPLEKQVNQQNLYCFWSWAIWIAQFRRFLHFS